LRPGIPAVVAVGKYLDYFNLFDLSEVPIELPKREKAGGEVACRLTKYQNRFLAMG